MRVVRGSSYVDHLRAVNSDLQLRGRAAIKIVEADASLEAVHVYFPDPWWKKRHRKRRVMNEGFLKNVERTLKPGRSLQFWTDVEEYFTTTLELIKNSTTLIGPLDVADLAAVDALLRSSKGTQFEGKAMPRIVEELANSVERIIVPEMNLGQLALEVERVGGRRKVVRVNRANGEMVTLDMILSAAEVYHV